MKFSDIIGQPKAIKLLSRALAGNRLAHGYLFTGPDGIGKTLTAHTLAARLLCESVAEERPCGHCGGCVKFASGNHPDFLVIKPDGAAIKIAQIRELKKSLTFAPFTAEKRVVIIEELQTMRREAGNSLLKILEEPPANNLLLLIASESENVLATIISRCQVIPFVPLTTVDAARIISRINPELDPEEAHTLALLTGGCPGRMEALHDEDVLLLRNECIKTLLQPDPGEAESVELALDLAARIAQLKDGLDAFLDLLSIFYKEVMIAALCHRESTGDGEMDAARERWNLEKLSAMIEAVEAARRALASNCNRGLVCEVLLLELFA